MNKIAKLRFSVWTIDFCSNIQSVKDYDISKTGHYVTQYKKEIYIYLKYVYFF